jgi:hypothetical protein
VTIDRALNPSEIELSRIGVIKMCANAYGKGKRRSSIQPPSYRSMALALGAYATTSLASIAGALAQQGDIAVTCTNPYSGATWQIRIDYDRSMVDSNPARINNATISWRDAKDGWNYTLDRKSGKLTVILASSTGGSFLYDQCKLEK